METKQPENLTRQMELIEALELRAYEIELEIERLRAQQVDQRKLAADIRKQLHEEFTVWPSKA